MNADGSGVRQVTSTPTFEFFPVWSPDGTKITFTGNTQEPDNFDVYVMNVDGSGIRRVTFNPPGVFDGRCDWGRLTPTNRDECKRGGWQRYNSPNFQRFRNQGQCVSWVNASQRNRL